MFWLCAAFKGLQPIGGMITLNNTSCFLVFVNISFRIRVIDILWCRLHRYGYISYPKGWETLWNTSSKSTAIHQFSSLKMVSILKFQHSQVACWSCFANMGIISKGWMIQTTHLSPSRMLWRMKKRISYHNGYLGNLSAAIMYVYVHKLVEFLRNIRNTCLKTEQTMQGRWLWCKRIFRVISSRRLGVGCRLHFRGLDCTSSTTMMDSRDTPRIQFNGSRTCWALHERSFDIKLPNVTTYCMFLSIPR